MNKIKSFRYLHFVLFALMATSSLNVFGQWSQTKKVAAADRFPSSTFGRNVSISNNYAVVSSDVSSLSLFSSGGYYLYEFKNGTWQFNRRLIWSNKKYRLGARGVEIKDSLMIVIGVKSVCVDSTGAQVSFCAAYFVYRLRNGVWIEDGVLELPPLGIFSDASVSISGNYAFVGCFRQDVVDGEFGNTAREAGIVYVYHYSNGSWNFHSSLHASNPANGAWFGRDISVDGTMAVIGAPRKDLVTSKDIYDEAGAAYAFELENGFWVEKAKFQPTDLNEGSNFGESVSMSNNIILIGAPFNSPTINGSVRISAGAAFLYVRTGGTWQFLQKITASDWEPNATFGWSVSVHNNAAIVSAANADTDTNGLNPMAYAGAAYIFLNYNGTWAEQSKIVAQDRDVEDFFGSDVAISNNKALVGAYLDDEDAAGQDTMTYAGSAYFFEGPAYVDINENIESPHQISLYPNPANETATLEYGNTFSGTGTIQLLDVQGRILYQEKIVFQNANGKTLLNIAHLPGGIYFVKLYNNQEIIIQRFHKVD